METFLNRRHMFFIGLVLYILRCFISYTSYPIPIFIITICWYGAQLCWLMAIFMRFEWNPVIIIEIAFIAYGLFSYKLTGSPNILAIVYMLLASKDIDCRDIISLTFKITAPLLGVSIVWYAINYVFGNVTVSKTREINGVVSLRHSFYFNHANGFSLFFLFTLLMFFYLKYNEYNKLLLYSILIAGAIFVYMFPNTRTVSVVFLAAIAIDLIFATDYTKIVRFFCKNLFVIGLVLIIVLAGGYMLYPDVALFSKVDSMMNGRLTMVAGAFNIYGINLTGHKIINEDVFIPQLGYFTLFIDNYWGMLVIRYGVISTVLVGVISMYTAYSMDKQDRRIELLLVSMICVFGLSESTALDIYPVFPWLFLKETAAYKYLENRP